MRTPSGVFFFALALAPGMATAQLYKGGDLVATNYSPAGLFRIEPTGAITQLLGPAQLAGPAGVIVTRAREIVLVDFTANSLLKLDRNGVLTPIAGSLGGPLRVTEDLDGAFLVASNTSRTILRVTPQGAVTTLIPTAGFTRPLDVAIDRNGDYLVVDDLGRSLQRVDRATLARTPIAGGGAFQLPQGITLFPNGDYCVFDGLTDSVFRVDRTSNQVSTWVTKTALGANPDALCADHEGGFWIGTTTPSFSLEHVLANGTLQRLVWGPPMTNYEGLALVPTLRADLEFVTGPSTSNSLDIDMPGQAIKLYSIVASSSLFPGIQLPNGDARSLAINPDGLFFATFYNGFAPVFANWTGLLDPAGKANATTAIPFVGPGAFAGLTIWAQVVTTDFNQPSGVGQLSNPLRIRFR